MLFILFRQQSLARGTFAFAVPVVASVTLRFPAGAALEQVKRAGIDRYGVKEFRSYLFRLVMRQFLVQIY